MNKKKKIGISHINYYTYYYKYRKTTIRYIIHTDIISSKTLNYADFHLLSVSRGIDYIILLF